MIAISPAPQRQIRYRVEEPLGRSGVATVFRAYDPLGERAVVIKSLRRDVAASALGARLLEQARAAARLSHPGIAVVHEVDESGPAAVIVSEYVPGQNLARWLAASPLPSAAVVVDVMGQLLEALGFAHRAGLRHGRLSQANVLLTPAGIVKITDFGMARMAEPATLSAAMRGLVAPEVAQGRPLDDGVDIYAAGVLLYRLLAGRDPEWGLADAGTAAVPFGAPRAPSTFPDRQRAAVFDAILACAMAREPGDRYASAQAFREALLGALDRPRPAHGASTVELGENAMEASRRGPPAGTAGMTVPVLTIAIPDEMLQRPAFDPWAAPLQASQARPVDDDFPAAPESHSDAVADVRTVLDHAEQGRRAHVASAARAASEALAAAALPRTTQAASMIQAEVFEPPSESIFGTPLFEPRPVSPGIPAEALRRVLRIITPHFGAGAGTVLKQVAGHARTVDEMHDLLLEQAGETVDRRKLRKQLRALARLPL